MIRNADDLRKLRERQAREREQLVRDFTEAAEVLERDDALGHYKAIRLLRDAAAWWR